MKKLLLLSLLQVFVLATFAQQNPRPTKSRFWNSKQSTFNIKPGDILVYSATKEDQQMDVIVTIKQFGKGINYEVSIPQLNTKNSVAITPSAFEGTANYSTWFASNGKQQKDQSSLWLSKRSYRDLAASKQTTMDFGDGKETFVRSNTGTMKINYKGRDKIITLYNIQNQSEGSSKAFSVLTDENNPLIVSMDTAWKMKLKEVR